MPKQWGVLGNVSNAFVGNAVAIGGSLGFTESATVIRMIGEYGFFCTAAPVALDSARITFAIGVVSSDAVALGLTAVPDPAAEPEYPWLFWASHLFRALPLPRSAIITPP